MDRAGGLLGRKESGVGAGDESGRAPDILTELPIDDGATPGVASVTKSVSVVGPAVSPAVSARQRGSCNRVSSLAYIYS